MKNYARLTDFFITRTFIHSHLQHNEVQWTLRQYMTASTQRTPSGLNTVHLASSRQQQRAPTTDEPKLCEVATAETPPSANKKDGLRIPARRVFKASRSRRWFHHVASKEADQYHDVRLS